MKLTIAVDGRLTIMVDTWDQDVVVIPAYNLDPVKCSLSELITALQAEQKKHGKKASQKC